MLIKSYVKNSCCVSSGLRKKINAISHFIVNEGKGEEFQVISEDILMDSVDKALTKADYDWDGYISWDEYVFSLGDKEVQHHVKEFETHEYDHHNNTTH